MVTIEIILARVFMLATYVFLCFMDFLAGKVLLSFKDTRCGFRLSFFLTHSFTLTRINFNPLNGSR
jgi:hypothetical protein